MGMKACWIEKCDELEYVVGCKKEEDGKKQDKKKKVDGNKQYEKKQEEEDAAANKEDEKKKRKDANKQVDDTHKQEEKKEEDEANKQEEKKKQEDDAHKQEEKKEDDAHKQEEEKKEEEDANKQEEKKKDEGEANKQEEKKKEEDDANKQEDNVGKQEDDAHKQKEIKKEEDEVDKQEEKKKEEDGTQTQEQKKKEEGEANKQEETKKLAEDDAHKQEEEEKNPAKIFKNLEILWISDSMNLKSILKDDIQSISFKSITSLYLEYCPLITTICSSSSQLENLETLYVKYCRKMDTLFTDDSPQLKRLTKLHLWGLQELKGITFKAPFLRSLKVGECPLLEHVIGASSKANEQQEVEGHDNLETLHIKYCDKVKSICEEDMPYFPKLRELEMWALPEVQEVAFSTPLLQYLRVGECRKLRQIEGSTSNRLDVLEVKHCEELKTVFGGGGLDVGNVEKIELLSLPEVDNVGGANLLPSTRENRIVWGCPKLCGTSLDS